MVCCVYYSATLTAWVAKKLKSDKAATPVRMKKANAKRGLVMGASSDSDFDRSARQLRE